MNIEGYNIDDLLHENYYHLLKEYNQYFTENKCPVLHLKEMKISQARILVQRLERLSADSIWAHRASGVRASLDKFLSKSVDLHKNVDKIESLIEEGFYILEKAAKEIQPGDDSS